MNSNLLTDVPQSRVDIRNNLIVLGSRSTICSRPVMCGADLILRRVRVLQLLQGARKSSQVDAWSQNDIHEVLARQRRYLLAAEMR